MWIQLTQADNTLTLNHVVLVTNIIICYDIDFSQCIEKEIHEQEGKRSTSISFPCLIHRLCVNIGSEILPNMDMVIEVQRT